MGQLFQKAYGKELAAANKQRAGAHNSLEGELGLVEQDIANLVAAVRRGFDNPSIKAELNALEARRRSEEPRVGKDCDSPCRSRWSTSYLKKKIISIFNYLYIIITTHSSF